MRRWRLSKREARRLIEQLKSVWPNAPLDNVKSIECLVDRKAGIDELYILDGKPAFVKLGEKLVPLINYLLEVGFDWMPRIVVDEGAVRPITRGANLMRPGIVSVEGEFRRGDLIVILEPVKRIPIAVHEALVDSEELNRMEKGVVSKRLHYIGDKLWKYASTVR